jgi:hypothetical protein
MIKQENGKYALYSHDGSKKLGEYDNEEEAQAREKQVAGFSKKPGSKFAAIKSALIKPKMPKI